MALDQGGQSVPVQEGPGRDYQGCPVKRWFPPGLEGLKLGGAADVLGDIGIDKVNPGRGTRKDVW